MKKTLSLVLSASLILSSAPSAFALNYGSDPKNAPQKAYTQAFSDVPPKHWAFSYISEMVERGVLSGYDDGKFYPDKYITRAESAKIIATLAGDYEKEYHSYLYDVPEGQWYTPYVLAVSYYFNKYNERVKTKAGYKTETLFHPDDIAERQHIIAALMQQAGGKYETDKTNGSLNGFDLQSENVSDDIIRYIECAITNRIVDGYSDESDSRKLLFPTRGITRAEMATLIYKMYNCYDISRVIDGKISAQCNCSAEDFVKAYNKNLADNYYKIENTDKNNLLGAKRYSLELTVSSTEDDMTIYMTSANNATLAENADGKLIHVEIASKSADSNIFDKSYRNELSLSKYLYSCAVMAMFNLSFEDAFSIVSARLYNKLYWMPSDKYICDVSASKFSISAIKTNSNELKPQSYSKAEDFINKYNNAVFTAFRQKNADVRFTSPYDKIIAKQSVWENISDLGKLPLKDNLYYYALGLSDTGVVCNAQNEVCLITGLKPEKCDPIAVIMALDNLSYKDAAAYYSVLLSDKEISTDNYMYTYTYATDSIDVYSKDIYKKLEAYAKEHI